jgi:hypothetical protein
MALGQRHGSAGTSPRLLTSGRLRGPDWAVEDRCFCGRAELSRTGPANCVEYRFQPRAGVWRRDGEVEFGHVAAITEFSPELITEIPRL